MSTICVIENQTGQSIKLVSVYKLFGSDPDGSFIQEFMDMNDTGVLSFTGGSGSGDYWTIQFTGVADGVTYYRNQKRCDVEPDDIQSTTPIYLNFLAPETGFSIELPVSDSCTDNRYDTK